MKKQQIRIIGGEWRSRRIQVTDGPGLRPTGDRNRETLFNWLAPYLPGARCLDLFAGSGILGFEALSRGAVSVTAIEKSRKVADQLRANTETLSADALHILQRDCLKWLEAVDTAPEKGFSPYSICFIDPPFHQGLIPACLERLAHKNVLAEEAFVYIEHEQGFALETALNDQLKKPWQLLRSKQAGQVVYHLYQVSH